MKPDIKDVLDLFEFASEKIKLFYVRQLNLDESAKDSVFLRLFWSSVIYKNMKLIIYVNTRDEYWEVIFLEDQGTVYIDRYLKTHTMVFDI